MVIEKIITIEEVPIQEFLGPQNHTIKALSAAFPKAKIISRGNEIKVIGTSTEILRLSEIIDQLQQYLMEFGVLQDRHISALLYGDESVGLTSPTKEKHLNRDTDKDVILYGNRGLIIKAKTPNQKKIVQGLKKHDLVFAIGPAGTGKTYVSVALAVKALKNKEVKKLVITRPAVEAGESLGYLPGDLKEKIDPYLRPIYDALEDMIPPDKLNYYYETNVIEIAPLAYMRGRTLHHAFILLDEAQNTTPMQMKMFLTRMGEGSKMIITGDRSQIDLPRNQKSGLVDAIDTLSQIDGISFIELTKKDVMRHKLVEKILGAYEKNNATTSA
ncbi:MAG: PhoH family protein [Cytophagaceae bacterium]|nr:PhoH family protein [Cytophagaceae bacterium]